MGYPSNTTHTFTMFEYTKLFNSMYRDGSQPDNNPFKCVGIPSPTWGVQHTKPSAPADWSSEVAGNYYIDHSTGSDSETYGTPSIPRKTLPLPIPAGSYIEIAGTYAEVTAGDIRVNGYGTDKEPIWIVGADGTTPKFNADGPKLLVWGSYVFISDIAVDGAAGAGAVQIASTSSDTFASDHIFLDVINVSGSDTTSGGISVVDCPTVKTNNVIILNPQVNTLGPQVDVDFDAHGVSLGDGVEDVWLLGGTIQNLSGSGVQIGSGQSANNCQRIYVGLVSITNTRQSGIWTKAGKDVVISKNIVHDIQDRCVGADTSPSKGIGGQYRLDRVWIIFNTIYNVRYGIRIPSTTASAGKVYAVGNVLHSINGSYSGGVCFPNDPGGTNNWDDSAIHIQGCAERYIVDNTIHSAVSGVHVSNAADAITHITGNLISEMTGTNGRHFFSEQTDGSITEMHHNLYFDATGIAMKWGGVTYTDLATYQSGTGFGANDISSDPLFADSVNFDLTPTSSSPAKSAGYLSPVYSLFESLYLHDIDVDHAGNARPNTGRSIGALEAA